MSKIAIIETGGKQYLVSEGTTLTVEKLANEKGSAVTFDKVLLVDDGAHAKVGAPFVAGAHVTAEVIAEGRADKITIIRYRPKSRHYVKKGHRQPFTKVKIVSIG